MASENFTAILRLVAFGTLITATSRATRGCGSISDVQPREVPLQPPDWVFGIVWPGLYLTTGIAWAMSGPDVDLPLGAATMLSCSWLVVYTCLRARMLAACVLLCTVFSSLAATLSSPSRAARRLLVPLTAWTAFATYLNLWFARPELGF